ncbi:MAG: alpha/beta fold hydrolase, partial [Pseudomonadota bacterium]
GHLLTYWDMCRNLFKAFPWYSEESRHQLGLGTPPVEMVHATLLRYLLAGEDYADAYRPAFYAENVEHMEGMDVPATMTRWESSPVLALADALIERGLPENIELLRAGHGLEARYSVQVEALRKHLAENPLPAFSAGEASQAEQGRRFLDSSIGHVHAHHRSGEGRPLVTLHSAGRSAGSFTDEIGGLVEGREVWALDLPHHGASPDLPAEVPHSPETLAAPLADALKGAGLKDIDVIASGLGAAVALALAEALDVREIRLVAPEPPSDTQRKEGLASGLPDLSPRLDGTHVIAAWDFARARRVFSPPWDYSSEGQRKQALSTDPREVHDEAAEMLRVGAQWRAMMELELSIDWSAIAARDDITMIEV